MKSWRILPLCLDFVHLNQKIWCQKGWHIHRQYAWINPTHDATCKAQVGAEPAPNMVSTGSGLTSQWASACGSPPPSWAPLFQALKLFQAVICWTGWVYLYKVGQLMACLLIRFLIFRKSASFPSLSRGCVGALYCLSRFTEGRFLTWPLTQRLGQNLHFSVKHEEQQGRVKHLRYPGKTWHVLRSQILCTLKLNISAGAKGQVESDRKVAVLKVRK